MAIAYTTLLWLLILGSFIVFGVVAIKTDSLLFRNRNQKAEPIIWWRTI